VTLVNKADALFWKKIILVSVAALTSGVVDTTSNLAMADGVDAVISWMDCQTTIAGPGKERKCITRKALERYGNGLRVCNDSMNWGLQYELVDKDKLPDFDMNTHGAEDGLSVRTLNIYGYYDEVGWPGSMGDRKVFLVAINLCRDTGLANASNVLFHAALKGARDNKNDCNQSVREAARELGYVIPTGISADGIVEYLGSNWKMVSMSESMRLAEEGRLVIAGATSDALNMYYITTLNPKRTSHGHVAVVSPYSPNSTQIRDGVKFPWVIGGALNNPNASSELSPYAVECQVPSRRAFPSGMVNDNGVKYFTPN
jgi:hypothetical protein